jgi:hypothetical protein
MSFTSQNIHYDSSSKRMSVPVTRFLLPNAIIGGGEVSEGLGPWRLPRASPDTPHALARHTNMHMLLQSRGMPTPTPTPMPMSVFNLLII